LINNYTQLCIIINTFFEKILYFFTASVDISDL